MKYKAEDGSEWATMQQALWRDADVEQINAIMKHLGERNDIPPRQYVQRDKETLFRVRRQLWAIILEQYGDQYPEWKDANPDDVKPYSGVGRVLSDGDSTPLSRAWSTLYRFNFDNYREYQQCYYALNPQEATEEFRQ